MNWNQVRKDDRTINTNLYASLSHRDLFNAAFLSCWSELSEEQQDELIRSIELALTSQDIAEVTQTLLNLAEFMEHSDKVMGSPPHTGGRCDPSTAAARATEASTPAQ